MKLLAFCYLLVFIACTLMGMLAQADKPALCDIPPARIEYVMPGFQFGCWLAGVPGE